MFFKELSILFFNHSWHSILFSISFRWTASWLDNLHFTKYFPNISSTHLVPYIVITVLLSIFPMLYFTSPWLFVTANLFFLIPSPFLPSPLPAFTPGNHQCVLWVCDWQAFSNHLPQLPLSQTLAPSPPGMCNIRIGGWRWGKNGSYTVKLLQVVLIPPRPPLDHPIVCGEALTWNIFFRF